LLSFKNIARISRTALRTSTHKLPYTSNKFKSPIAKAQGNLIIS
jgi:hypothetical protein